MSNAPVPEGWTVTTSLELADLIRGVSYQKDEASHVPGNGLVPLLRATNIGSGLLFEDLQYVPAERVSPDQSLQQGDVVIAMSSGSKAVVGKAAQLHTVWDGTFGAFCGVLRPSDLINHRFFGLFFGTKEYRDQISDLSAGTNINNLKREYFNQIPFPLPPLAEQRRIVEKVEALLAPVGSARERLKRVTRLLKRFRQAVLAAAASGDLTQEWREARGDGEASSERPIDDEPLPDGWRWSSPEQVKAPGRHTLAIGPFGSNLKVSDYVQEGVPLVFVRDIRARSFGGPITKYITTAKGAELRPHAISAGDLLITKMGAPPGDVAIYPPGCPDAVITADCIKLRVNNNIALSAFVGYVIESPSFRSRLAGITVGVAQQKISLERFRNFPLQLAPLAEQQEVVRRVQDLMALADTVESRVTAAFARGEKLPQSILSRAFAGELVPTEAELAGQQGRAFEDAAALLERVKVEREAAVSSGNGQSKRSRTTQRRVAKKGR